MKHYILHTDGGSRGNPGHAAVGVIIDQIEPDGKLKRINGYGKYIGIATNNVAEYSAVSIALKQLISMQSSSDSDANTYEFYLDSLLVVSQLNGKFKIKDSTLMKHALSIRALEKELGGVVRYIAVRREFNTVADRQVNAALDERTSR